jgi:hypothetical protein
LDFFDDVSDRIVRKVSPERKEAIVGDTNMVDIAGDDMTKDMSKQEKRALAIAKLAKVLIPAKPHTHEPNPTHPCYV